MLISICKMDNDNTPITNTTLQNNDNDEDNNNNNNNDVVTG